MKIPARMAKDYTRRAQSERAAGGHVKIYDWFPAVSVTMSGGDEFYFQDHEASELLDSVPDNMNPSDFILAMAQGW